jgi:hypothetical protein
MFKIIIFLLFLVPIGIFAQDNIVMTDGNVKNGKIISDDGHFVKYVDNDGNVFSIKKDYIKEIHYKNPNNNLPVKHKLSNKSNRDIVAFNVLALAYSNFGISFEHISNSGYLGFRIPFSFQFRRGEDPVFTRHLFQGGIDLNYYPTGQGRIRYFVGPSISLGTVESVNFFEINPGDCKPVTSNHTSFSLRNGIMWNNQSDFSMSTSIALGIRHFENDEYSKWVNDSNNNGPFIRLECTLGFRF